MSQGEHVCGILCIYLKMLHTSLVQAGVAATTSDDGWPFRVPASQGTGTKCVLGLKLSCDSACLGADSRVISGLSGHGDGFHLSFITTSDHYFMDAVWQ